MNLTKEIIDETSILYREEPIYQVVDSNGKGLNKDQKLWEQIQKDSRYLTFMDKLDRWTKLLGTVLVKVSFVDPNTGQMVDKTQPGVVQLDLLHGGVYDIRHGASPYYITELLIGFGTKFGGFQGNTSYSGGGINRTVPDPSNLSMADIEHKQKVHMPGQLGTVDRIYWSPSKHTMKDAEGKEFETKNPYGMVPAVPFFNQDPAHYYFLPINEPLIYANHAINMRITDLNHIAKFQSFGIPVVKGAERPTSLRQGRPVDDFNVLKGGNAQSKFGGLHGTSGFGAGGHFRTFDSGMGILRDGNADAASLGMTLGPDTAVAVGEKGDFKFAHPGADITGLIKSIHSISDMVRINHGLRPKHDNQFPASGYAQMLEKMGVIEENIRRGKLFREREQQLFQVIKQLWNTHNAGKSGNPKFSDDARLEVTYVPPKFPVDPKTEKEDIMMESKILATGDRQAIKKLYPYKSESEITKVIKQFRKDKKEQQMFETELQVELGKELQKAGMSLHGEQQPQQEKQQESSMEGQKPKIDNKSKHSEDSSKQPGKNGDQRKVDRGNKDGE